MDFPLSEVTKWGNCGLLTIFSFIFLLAKNLLFLF
jgi:hypothetical protein